MGHPCWSTYISAGSLVLRAVAVTTLALAVTGLVSLSWTRCVGTAAGFPFHPPLYEIQVPREKVLPQTLGSPSSIEKVGHGPIGQDQEVLCPTSPSI